MATKKAGGSSRNGRDSRPKYLGVKRYGGQVVRAGEVLIRQRGSQYHEGEFVYRGKDYTLHAKIDGVVSFAIKGAGRKRTVSIIPLDDESATVH